MSAPTIAATTVSIPAIRITQPLPELPDLGMCDCGRELVCLIDGSGIVFCERCDLGA
ncbi:hypothetical protein [Streptomyces griseofuscus]|uniref:hypothetical protein n=1 Tax=Streptomyces griseofuscus TaxID=146922 RepID=UPI0033DF1F49